MRWRTYVLVGCKLQGSDVEGVYLLYVNILLLILIS